MLTENAPGNAEACGVIIRAATVNDIPAIAEIEAACFSRPWSEKALSDTLESDFGHLVCAETPDGVIAGYAGIYCLGDAGEITNIATLPAFRRRGIAAAVITFLLSTAAEHGARDAYLEVRDSNVGARHLYESLGFFENGRRKNFYQDPREDAVLMTKPLQKD